MKALIHGYFGMGNVGDEAILSVLIEELKSKHIEPVILSADPNRTAKLHSASSCYDRFLSLKFWRNFLSSSMLVFAGGGRYGKGALRSLCLFAVFAKALGKKVEFRAIGVYPYEWVGIPVIMSTPVPFSDLLTRALIKMGFNLADRVTVRDGFSKRTLIASGVANEVGIEGDLAFKLKPSSIEDALRILSRHGVNVNRRPLVGVNLRTLYPKVNRRVISMMSDFLDWLIVKGAEVVFVPFGYGSTPERFFDNDLIVANELKESMRNAEKLAVIDVEYSPQKILSIFRLLDLFIGMRFHSIIFSVMMEVPTMGIVYDTKTMELLRRRRIRRCVSVLISDLNTDMLKNATNKFLRT